jgi:HTH-type transcriptional regulator/antitoxin HigA
MNMNIQPIRTQADHAEALHRIEALWGAAADTAEGMELDVLATLVERYEENRWPVEASSPLELLKFAMEQNGYAQSDLAHLLGSRSRASEVLSGRRSLTLDQIRLVSKRWHIPVALLVGEPEDVATR